MIVDKRSTPTPKPKVRIITFGAGSKGAELAIQRLRKQALGFPWFDEFRAYSQSDLGADYFSRLSSRVHSNPKGYGLWSWKPYLIHRELKSMPEGDILVYLDVGVEVNRRGSDRFTYYLDHLARENVLVFSIDHQHRQWTKNDSRIFDYGKNYFRNQVAAGILMFKVSKKAVDLVSAWEALCFDEQGDLLREAIPKSDQEHEDLIEHRHDQSLLSRVVFDQEIVSWHDETMFKPWRNGLDFPFLAMRNKSSRFSWLYWAFATPFIFWRVAYVLTDPGLLRKSLSKIKLRLSEGLR